MPGVIMGSVVSPYPVCQQTKWYAVRCVAPDLTYTKFINTFASKPMSITEATSEDWTDFWENEMPAAPSFNQEQIAAMLSVSEQIQEQIEIVGELWEMTDFEVTALCGMVADAFADNGIKMEALV